MLLSLMIHDVRGDKMKLGDLANIRSGLVLSRKLSKEPTIYKYNALNFRSIRQDNTIDISELDAYNATEKLKTDYLSKKNDIIVRLTAPYNAILIDDNTSNIVISSNFLLIRVNKKFLSPEYLFWYLNTEKSKRAIYKEMTTNMLAAVNAKYFTELNLEPISLENQNKIGKLNLLAINEVDKLHKLAEEKQKYYSYVISDIHSKMKRGN